MNIKMTLKNYRCFADSNPAQFEIRDGFISLIGANNSGKSSILKFFYEFRPLFEHLQPLPRVSEAINNFRGTNFNGVVDDEEIFFNGNDRDITVRIDFEDQPQLNPPYPDAVSIVVPRNKKQYRITLHTSNGDVSSQTQNHPNEPHLILDNQTKQPLANVTAVSDVCRTIVEMMYIGPFRNAINAGSKQDYFDITVGDKFIGQWRDYKTGNVKQRNEAAYRITREISHIFGFDELQIDPSSNDQTLQVFINGKSFKLPEIGSGLTQFILTLVNAAVKQPTFILIDEPELNLHPSLQLDFLTTLGSYAKNGVVFATHNIGLARASSDLIYSVRLKPDRTSDLRILESTPRLSELLGELSFSGYRELGFKQILLVEGSTDVRTIQQFLRWHGKDHEIVLLPLGGSSLINASCELELEEIKRISDNVAALIDSEKDAAEASLPEERMKFVEICKELEIRCHVLERRATENYLPENAVKKVKGDKYRALEPFERLKDIKLGWAKDDNWRMAREMKPADLAKTDLGEFLRSL